MRLGATEMIVVLVIALLLPVMAVSLPLAALTVYYRDFRYVIPFAVQVWLFLSPVAYPVTAVREGLRVPYAAANPIVGSLEGFRRVFAVGAPPNWTLLGVSVAASLALLLLAARVFTRLEREFADVI